MSSGIEVRNLRKVYAGRAAVDGVSFDIHDRDLFAIVGASGCGKSTLLRLIAGLEHPDDGELRLHGQTVAGPGVFVPPEARGTGFVFQSYALWPHMSVTGNVAFPLEAQGKSRKAAAREAAAHLQTVALTDLADRRPEALSGGQRQRVALARCLAGGARTILMDEPLANLDPHLRGAMEAELMAFHRRSGATTIYITHDQREAMALATRMAVMAQGRFLQVGTPQEIYDRPASATVAGFIGHGAIFDMDYRGGAATFGGLSVPVDTMPGQGAGPVKVLIRPEDVDLSGDGAVQGRISAPLYRGGQWEATLHTPMPEARLQITSRRPLHDGDTVAVHIRRGWVLPG